ncbi:MAG: type II toxin-antitoxin system prevent-host-death family antitoxin [Sphingomonadaceae bacterium]|nr:type II toxin-antitoxin system prevent-host-death family antitoxin [Sphingomonadaceae bacterium]
MGKHVTIGAAEANRSFSKLLRAVKDGDRITITSHGEPVAEMRSPADRDADEEKAAREKAWEELQARWARSEFRVIGPWSREEIWDEITR